MLYFASQFEGANNLNYICKYGRRLILSTGPHSEVSQPVNICHLSISYIKINPHPTQNVTLVYFKV